MIKRFGAAILGLTFAFGAFGASALTAEAKNDKDKGQRNGRWSRDQDERRNNDDDRRWRDRNRRDDRRDDRHGRGYNNGRYGYPGNNNGRYGNGRSNNGRYGNGDYNNGRYGNGGYNNGNYGNNNYELNRGYQQGLNTGSSDARRGQSYSPQRSHFYRDASTQAFREGFVRGYDQGYRQYAGYNNNNGYRNNSGSIWSQILGVPFN